MNEPWDVVVVGSCMIDLICYAPRLPKNGETLQGRDFSVGFGGKGSNQCVAAKKLGAKTLLIGRVGNDSFGRDYLKHLKELEIPVNHIQVSKGVTSGMAQITVADNGENQIVIVPGANLTISENDLNEAEELIKNCTVLICQMEINPNSTKKALEIKSQSGIGKTILNGAPAIPDMEPYIFTLPDIFCVNESEAEIFTGLKINDMEEAKEALIRLIQKGCREVIITLGEKGALYGNNFDYKQIIYVPAKKVTPVDCTGAGDAFIGALGYFLSKHPNMKMSDIIEKACAAGTVSVQKRGTQQSFPNSLDLLQS